MNKVMCDKGHYFNADKYDECPVCKSIGVTLDIQGGINTHASIQEGTKDKKDKKEKKDRDKGWFSKNKKQRENIDIPPKNTYSSFSNSQTYDDEKTVLLDSEKTVLLDDEKTVFLSPRDLQPTAPGNIMTSSSAKEDLTPCKTGSLMEKPKVVLVCVRGEMLGAEYALYDNETIRIGNNEFKVRLSDKL